MKVPCKYNPGDKIFAKVKGFVYWPARVNPLPSDIAIPPNKIPIFFYGTHEVYFISPTSCWPFDEKNKTKWGKSRPRAYFNQGMDEIENYSTIYQYGVDPLAEDFLSQFYEFKKSNGQNSTPNKMNKNESTEENDDVEEDKEGVKKSNKKRNKSGSSTSMKENKSNVKPEINVSEIKLENLTEIKDETISPIRKRRISESALSSKENKSNDTIEKLENIDEIANDLSNRKRQKSNSSSVELASVMKPRKSSKKKSKSLVSEIKKEKLIDSNKRIKVQPIVNVSLISNIDNEIKDEHPALCLEDSVVKQENYLDDSSKSPSDDIEKNSSQAHNSHEMEEVDIKPATRCRAKSSSTKVSNNQSVTSAKKSDHDSESPSVDSDNLADEDFRPATKVKRLTKKVRNQKQVKSTVKKVAKPKATPKSKGSKKKQMNLNVNEDDSLSSISSVEDFKTKIENQKKEYEEKLKTIQLQQLEMEENAVKEASKRTKAKRMSESLAVESEIGDGKVKLNENKSSKIMDELNIKDCKLEKEVLVNICKTDIFDDVKPEYVKDNIKNEVSEVAYKEDINDKDDDVKHFQINELTSSDTCTTNCNDKPIDWSESGIKKELSVLDEINDLPRSTVNEFLTTSTTKKKDNIIETPPINKKPYQVDEPTNKEIDKVLEVVPTVSVEKIKKVKINLKELKITKSKTPKPPANRKRNRKISSSISSGSDIEIVDIKYKEPEPKMKRLKMERNSESDDNKKEMKNGDKSSADKVQILQNFNTDIRSSLVLGHEDYKICLERFKSLCEMDIDLLSLVKVWQLMDTVKKCRRYKRNEQLKQEAQAVYKRFMEVYSRASKEEINTSQSLLMQYRHQSNIQNQNVGMEPSKANGNATHGLTIPFSVADMFQNKQSCPHESNSSKVRSVITKEGPNSEKPCTPGNAEDISKPRSNPTEEEINEEKMRLLSVDLEAKVCDILNKIEKNVDINPINQRSLSHLLPSDDNATIKLPTQWKTVHDKPAVKEKAIDEEISDDDEEDVEAIVRRIEEVAIKLTEPEMPDISNSNGNSSALDVRIENLINSSFISTKDSRQRKSRTSSRHHNKATKISSPVRVSHSKSEQPELVINISDIELPTEQPVPPQLEEQKDDIEIYDLLGV